MNQPSSPQPGRPSSTGNMTDEQLQAFAIELARLIDERHCTDVLVMDTRKVTNLTDFIVIGTGRSDRQIRSLGDEVEKLAQEHGLRRIGTDIDQRATWVVIDLSDIVVHLFAPEARAYYDLEMLWGDAPRLEWKRG